jgi:hypothetical protein
LLIITLVFGFQDCSNGNGPSSYAKLNQSSSASLNCGADATSCLYQGVGNGDALSLRLDSWVLQNVSATSSSVILTGSCVDGAFPRTRIYWELVDVSGHVWTTSLLQSNRSGCNQGNFSEVITGFTSSTGAANFTAGTALQVRFTLNGINDQGSLISPTNAAQATTIKPLIITP